jgi:hypothetical protein
MRYRLQALNSRVLTAVLVVGLPVLVIGTAVVLAIGQIRLKDAEAARLERIAEYVAGSVDAYFFRSILDTAVLARVPAVRRTAEEGSARPFDREAALELDREWQRDGAAAAARTGLLESETSQFLADLRLHDSVFREVLLTDRYGRLVAASNITSDYFQADESWWYDAFAQGAGRVHVTDVRRDESVGVYAFEIAMPVPLPTGEIVGVMKIVADSREMLADVAGLDLGDTAEATLVRSDGSIVFSRRPHAPDDRFFAADLMRQQLESRAQRTATGPLHFEAGAEDRSHRLVVLAQSQLRQTYPDLDWYVALSVAEDEMLAPFRSLIWYLMIAFALTAIAVLAIALWLSLRLAAPTIDPATGLHLVEHPAVRQLDAEP